MLILKTVFSVVNALKETEIQSKFLVKKLM